MFSDIGAKIKLWAKVICWASMGLFILIGLVSISEGMAKSNTSSILAGFLAMFLGSGLSWVGSFFIYGFGQLIENTDKLVEMKQNKDKDNISE